MPTQWQKERSVKENANEVFFPHKMQNVKSKNSL